MKPSLYYFSGYKNYFVLFSVFLLICAGNSCNKDEIEPIESIEQDYRDKFVGIYVCDGTYTYEGSTRIFQDTLKVFKSNYASYDISIHIKNKNGNWVGNDMRHNYANEFYGYHSYVTFPKDSIFYTASGPLGAYSTSVYKGRKINQ